MISCQTSNGALQMGQIDVRDFVAQTQDVDSLLTLLARRDRELQELNHRIANSLQIASALLAFQQKRLLDPNACAALEDARTRLDAVGKLHRYLYAHGEDTRVDLRRFLHDLCPDIADSTGLRCSLDVGPVSVTGEMAQQLSIIINELAMNASKHAFGDGPKGTLKVHAHEADGNLHMSIADNGKGLGDDFDIGSGKGLGMSFVNAIVCQMGGTLKAEDSSGARFTLVAPLS
jgi:two-component sensor histidine kinase